MPTDTAARTATVDGTLLTLTPREFDLLVFLCSSPGKAFTREDLLREVWNSEPEWQNVSTVTEHVHRLRTKLRYASTDSLIRTVRGVGYQFDPTSGPS